MARAKVVHSVDACTIIFKGDVAHPEPSTGVIQFPGGHVEVSRTSNNQYWAHVEIYQEDSEGEDKQAGLIVDSRIDYDFEAYTRMGGMIPPIPEDQNVVKLAVLVGLDPIDGGK